MKDKDNVPFLKQITRIMGEIREDIIDEIACELSPDLFSKKNMFVFDNLIKNNYNSLHFAILAIAAKQAIEKINKGFVEELEFIKTNTLDIIDDHGRRGYAEDLFNDTINSYKNGGGKKKRNRLDLLFEILDSDHKIKIIGNRHGVKE